MMEIKFTHKIVPTGFSIFAEEKYYHKEWKARKLAMNDILHIHYLKHSTFCIHLFDSNQ